MTKAIICNAGWHAALEAALPHMIAQPVSVRINTLRGEAVLFKRKK